MHLDTLKDILSKRKNVYNFLLKSSIKKWKYFNSDFQVLNGFVILGSNSFALMYILLKRYKLLPF